MRVDLKANEIIVKAANSTHYVERGKLIGKLILTNQRIYFASVNGTADGLMLEIEPANIKEVFSFRNRILFSNGLCLLTKDGHELKFEVGDRDGWAAKIARII